MKYVSGVVSILLFLYMVPSTIFVVHNHYAHFNKYQEAWNVAHRKGDMCRMWFYYDAESLVMDDTIPPPPPWYVFTKWNHDYIKELDAFNGKNSKLRLEECDSQ